MKRKNDNKCFGERLRAIRKERGYSMDQLCDSFNKFQNSIRLNKSTISRYENGTQEPMLSTVAALAKFFNISAMYLTGESDVKHSDKESSMSFTSITDEEKMLLELFRRVPADSQQLVLDMIRIALKRDQ